MSTAATITIDNAHATRAMSQYRTVALVIDHAALVSAGRSRSDGRDLYVRHSTAGPVKVFVLNPNTTTTTVYFALQESLAALGQDKAHVLHWGYLDRPNPTPYPLRDLSQWQRWRGTGDSGYRPDRGVAPFLFFDDFAYKISGSFPGDPTFAAYAGSDTPDSDIYEMNAGHGFAIVLAGIMGGAMVTGGNSDFMRVSNWPNVSHRVRATMLIPAGAAAPNAGVLASQSGSTLNGYGAGIGSAYTTREMIEWTSDVPANLQNVGGLASLAGTAFDVEVAAGNSSGPGTPSGNQEVHADVAGQILGPINDVSAVKLPGGPGLYNDVSGSGTVLFSRIMVELWDGVRDSDMSVSITVPALSLPSPGHPLEEIKSTGIRRLAFGDFVSIQAKQVHAFNSGGYRLNWANISAEDFYEIIAFHDSLNSAGSFLFTAPNDTEKRYVVEPGSFTTTKGSASKYSAAMTLQEVPL